MKFEFVLHRTKQKRELLNSNDRLHFHQHAQITHRLRSIACREVKEWYQKNDEPFEAFHNGNPCTVKVIVYSPTKRRLDPPNIYPTVKALIDGFTDGGLWVDDNHEVIKSMSFEYGGLSGSKAYRIELDIKKCERKSLRNLSR